MNLDDVFLARIRSNPEDPGLRLDYAAALAEKGDARALLIRLEETMRSVGPTDDTFWALRSERNRLRDVIDAGWRDELGYGARQEHTSLRPWPDDTRARWRLIRTYIESWHGVRTEDVGRSCPRLRAIEEKHACGASLREWIVLLDDLKRDGWEYVFRDSLSLEPIPKSKHFSLMIQGEGDYHWAVALADMAKDDPPVTGFHLDIDTGCFARSKRRAAGDSVYGSYPRITDFAVSLIKAYEGNVLPHPRLRAVPR